MRKSLKGLLGASSGGGSTSLSAKYAPKDPRKTLLFVGQDVGSVAEYVRGTAHGNAASGVTSYTALSDRRGASLNGLAPGVGKQCPIDYGAGEVDAGAMLRLLPNAALSIGLDVTATSGRVVGAGKHDKHLEKLGEYIGGLAPRPVFLRIGYEADGPWNGYSPPDDYVKMFQYIAEFVRARVSNVAIVWQVSTSRHTGGAKISKWWPGPDFVDWVGGSFFEYERAAWKELFGVARTHGKPVFVCESAPQGFDIVRGTVASGTEAGQDARNVTNEKMWKLWFQPFFKFIEENRDVIRAVAYINCNWNSQQMWTSGATGYWGDTRVSADTSGAILSRWNGEVGDGSRWVLTDSSDVLSHICPN